MKNTVKKPYRLSFKPCRAFFVYLCFIVFSFIFTQALRNTVSAVLFVFSLLLPFSELIYLFFSYFALKFAFSVGNGELIRNEGLELTFSYRNRFILPYFFLSAELYLPNDECTSSVGYRIHFSSFPFRTQSVRLHRTMKHRGIFELGINSVYVYGIFKFFRIRLRVHEYDTATVFPRVLSPDMTLGEEKGETHPSDTSLQSTDGGEPAGVRDYVESDPLKRVHWKLSSKSEKLLVKLYSAEENNKTVIFPDMRQISPSDPCGGEESLEYALGIAKALCFGNKNVTLSLPFNGGQEEVNMNSPESFDIGYSISPSVTSLSHNKKFPPSVKRGEGEKRIYFTSRLDPATEEAILSQSSHGDTVFYISPSSSTLSDTVLQAFSRLGIRLYVILQSEQSEVENERQK